MNLTRVVHMGLKKRKVLTLKEREQITAESFKHGCVIVELAKSYDISVKTIYGWRVKYRNNQGKSSNIESPARDTLSSNNSFVEVAVIPEKHLVLQKAELVFNDVVLSIQGNFNSTKLQGIIKLLEGSC